jgi:hypothetical protein
MLRFGTRTRPAPQVRPRIDATVRELGRHDHSCFMAEYAHAPGLRLHVRLREASAGAHWEPPARDRSMGQFSATTPTHTAASLIALRALARRLLVLAKVLRASRTPHATSRSRSWSGHGRERAALSLGWAFWRPVRERVPRRWSVDLPRERRGRVAASDIRTSARIPMAR